MALEHENMMKFPVALCNFCNHFVNVIDAKAKFTVLPTPS